MKSSASRKLEGKPSSGIILEHIVLSSILRYSKLNPCYYRSKNDLEVDFILSDDDAIPHKLIQVTDDLNTSREREVRALQQTMDETGLCSAIIVSMDSRETIDTQNGPIEVIPAWDFALNAPS